VYVCVWGGICMWWLSGVIRESEGCWLAKHEQAGG
jgi:hypothetical protein